MQNEALERQQAALDAEDAELELSKIAELYARVGELRESVRALTASLREQKRLLKEVGWDLQHRLDMASKKRVRDRDARTMAQIGNKGKGGNGAKPKG